MNLITIKFTFGFILVIINLIHLLTNRIKYITINTCQYNIFAK